MWSKHDKVVCVRKTSGCMLGRDFHAWLHVAAFMEEPVTSYTMLCDGRNKPRKIIMELLMREGDHGGDQK